jgi:glycosyltransferase involved in cell wall biosynthesis
MKILVIHEIDYFNKAVFEFQILSEIFSSFGHEVTVIDYPQHKQNTHFQYNPHFDSYVANNIQRTLKNASLTVVRPSCSKFPLFTRVSYVLNIGKLIKKIVSSQKIDFIFLYSVAHNGKQTIRLAKKYHIPVIFRSIDILHKIAPKKIYRYPVLFFEKYVYQNSDLILALTPKLKDYVIKLGANPSKVKLQPAGVDTDLYKPLPKNLELAKKWGIGQNDKVVLFAGTLYGFSTLDWLAENWKSVLENIPEAKLLILGNGPLFPNLQKIIKKNALEKSVILADWQPYELLPDFINLADICINLFQLNDITREIIPTKLFQYLACAKPVVALPLPGTVDILPGEKEGMVYAKGNQDALNLIIKLLKDENKAGEIGENGYRLTKEKYDWKKIAENILETVKSI